MKYFDETGGDGGGRRMFAPLLGEIDSILAINLAAMEEQAWE